MPAGPGEAGRALPLPSGGADGSDGPRLSSTWALQGQVGPEKLSGAVALILGFKRVENVNTQDGGEAGEGPRAPRCGRHRAVPSRSSRR